MKQYVLVAGFDYKLQGLDFRELCDNRRRAVVATDGAADEDLRFITIDVGCGEMIWSSYRNGSIEHAKTHRDSYSPVGNTSYEDVRLVDGTTARRFKRAQHGTLSITDVYRVIREIGTTDPGTLAELSIFSHAFDEGPILVNSDDGFPGDAARDLDDLDARGNKDFVAPTMDAAMLEQFRQAFAEDALVWLWGCNYRSALRVVLDAIVRSDGYKPFGLGDETRLTLRGVEGDPAAMEFLERYLRPVLGQDFSANVPALAVEFKHLKHWAAVANQSTYAVQIANAADVTVHAAAVATWTQLDQGGEFPLMYVFPEPRDRIEFYRNYLGMTFDPDGRRYVVFKPDNLPPKSQPFGSVALRASQAVVSGHGSSRKEGTIPR